MELSLDNNAITERLMEVCGVDSLSAVASIILNDATRSGSWKRGNRIPPEVFIKAAIKFDSSIDYIVFGTQPSTDISQVETAFHKALIMLLGTGCFRKGSDYKKETIDEVINYFGDKIVNNRHSTDFDDMEKLIDIIE